MSLATTLVCPTACGGNRLLFSALRKWGRLRTLRPCCARTGLVDWGALTFTGTPSESAHAVPRSAGAHRLLAPLLCHFFSGVQQAGAYRGGDRTGVVRGRDGGSRHRVHPRR